MDSSPKVLVVGAGPTPLALACGLLLHGEAVRAIDHVSARLPEQLGRHRNADDRAALERWLVSAFRDGRVRR